uniref:C2H2-type domain-containing protein n=1 Tax=Sphaeramia orbicularis TaxID=375764 RepID=A0A672ZF34_9TELE
MCPKVQILRSLVEQRLTAAAEEIFGLFERTIAEYEEELCRTKEENQRQRQILDCYYHQNLTVTEKSNCIYSYPTDVQQLSVVKKEVAPEQQEWNPIVDQEEPEPELPQIKEEQEELQTSQEVNITRFPSTPVPVKSEDDYEEKVKSLQLQQTQTEEKSKSLLEEHMDTHTGQKLVGSSECEATFSQKKNMTQETNSPRDMMKNTVLSPSDGGCEKKPYHCSVCTKTFSQKSHLEIHMTSHTGEKRFKCSLCHKCFRHRSNLKRHMRAHTGEKLFHCPVCQKRFICNSHLTGHMIIHTGEKPFSCSECGKRFTWKIVLERHMRLHTGEKPFSCSECGKRFTRKMGLERHVMLHTGEKPFSCSECGKRFTRKTSLERHMIDKRT